MQMTHGLETMARLNNEAVAEHEARNTIKSIVVLNDSLNCDQALYVDGKLVESDPAIYAHDIERACKGSACMVVTRNVDPPDEWPEDLSYFDESELQ
jgi:hypothetical protein